MTDILYALRFALHQLRLWVRQAQQREALSDIEHANFVRQDATRRFARATSAEIAERLAFDQYRRVMREVTR